MNDGFTTRIELTAGAAAEIGPETAGARDGSTRRLPLDPALAVSVPVSPRRRAQVAGYCLRPGRPVFAWRGSTAGFYGFAALASLSIALHFVAACTSPDCDARPGTAECGVEVVITATMCPGPREPDLAQNYIPIYASCSSDDDCGAGRCQVLLGGPSRRMTFWNTVDDWLCYDSYTEWDVGCENEPCMWCAPHVKPLHCTTHFPDFLKYVEACAPVEGSRGLNESCAASADCEAGLVCIVQFSKEPHPSELGYCGTPVPTACPCAATEECLPNDVCFKGICQPGRLAQESCLHPDACIRGTVCAGYPGFCTPSSGDLGAPCSEHQDCMPKSLVCSGGTCQNPFGEACVTDYQCGPGASCGNFIGWTEGGCWEHSCEWRYFDECVPLGDGYYTSVSRPVPCIRPRCLPNAGTRQPGMSCWRDEDCEASFVCRAGSCQVQGSLGDSCSTLAHCESGLFCSSTEGSTCQALRQAGQPCGESTDCESGLRCNEGFVPPLCHPPASSGERCASHGDCAEPLLCGRGEVGCGALSKEGETCLSSADCVPPSTCADGACHDRCYYYRF